MKKKKIKIAAVILTISALSIGSFGMSTYASNNTKSAVNVELCKRKVCDNNNYCYKDKDNSCGNRGSHDRRKNCRN